MASTADSPPRPGKPFAKPSALPTPAERDALGWLHTARFLTTAAQLVHLPELDTPQNAEAVMVAHVHGQERLVVLGDNGSCKRKRGASCFTIDASRILPH